jgi:meso-butanediol dehydrogenase/(S,S)-butanediol dehydrogenase/diacetyl reductase
VNTGSDCALEGWEYLTSYSAAKFGVRGLTQALAKELGPCHINVNCVCPGIIDTDMWIKTDEMLGEINNKGKGESWNEKVEAIPLRRGGLPSDIGNGVVFLFSEYADYITGCSLPVGGGSSVN